MSLTINMQGVSSPYLRHYVGPWFMDANAIDSEIAQIEQTNLTLHIQNVEQMKDGAAEENPPKKRYVYDFDNSTGIAQIEVSGALMKVEASLMESMSSVMLSRTFREMASNPNVKGVMVKMDSPGGTASGTDELASAFEKLSAAKPTAVYVSGMMASAAYWVGSQARTISSSAVSDTGSIGTYCVVKDYSKVAAESGVKIHVIKAGEFKGMGEPGLPITDKMLAELQRRVDDKQAVFSAAVAKGRGVSLETVTEWADGRCHVAGQALSMGLIDFVETYDQALERLKSTVNTSANSRSTDRIGALMGAATTNDVATVVKVDDVKTADKTTDNAATTATAATVVLKSSADRIAEIKSACPGADSEFVLKQVENNASIQTAQTNYISILSAKTDALEETVKAKAKEITDLQAEKTELEGKLEQAKQHSTNTPVKQEPTGQAGTPKATASDPVSLAKAEWAENKGNCQDKFLNEAVYVGYRKVAISGGLRDSE